MKKRKTSTIQFTKRKHRYIILLIASIFFFTSKAAYSKTSHPEKKTPSAMIKILKERAKEIKRHERRLDQRETQLQILEKEVSDMLDQVTKLRSEIDQIEADKKNARKLAEEKRIANLTKIYQEMSAKVAAARLDKMKESVAIQLFQRFQAKTSAKILAKMDSKKAARISEKLMKK
ncbi:MAG: MotE family protein [Nitrospiria bacterium]